MREIHQSRVCGYLLGHFYTDPASLLRLCGESDRGESAAQVEWGERHLTLAAENEVEWSESSTTCCLMFRNVSRAFRLVELGG